MIHILREMLCTLGVWVQTIVGGVMLFRRGPCLLDYLLASKYLILQVLSEIPPRCVDFIYALGTLRVERVLDVMK
jgi:hypothetical protein